MSLPNNNKKHLGRPVPAKVKISMKGLVLHKDIYEQLKFAYAVSPRNTIRAFKKVGIVITGPEDLRLLADLHNSGLDVAGFRGRDQKMYAFNVREIINRPDNHPDRIHATQQMRIDAPIEWTDIYKEQGQIKNIQ